MPQELTIPDAIRREADAQGLDPAIALAIAEKESSFLPDQLGPQLKTGERAVGTFQFLPSTAKSRGNFDPYDPGANIHEGVRYLKELLDRHQDPEKALAEYGGVKNDQFYVPDALNRIKRYQQINASRERASLSVPAGGRAPGTAPPPVPPGWDEQHPYLAALTDYALLPLSGVGKGVMQTPTNIGEAIHKIPGVSGAVESMWDKVYGARPNVPEGDLSKQAFGEAQHDLQPVSTGESVGKFAEQVGELIAPGKTVTGAAAKAEAMFAPRLAPYVGQTLSKILPRAVVEGAGGAGMAAAQGGDWKTGAAIGAAVPSLAAVAPAATKYLQQTAEKKMSQALGAGSLYYKTIADRIIPEMLERGVWGSRAHLIEKSTEKMLEFGQQIDAALKNAAGDVVRTKPIRWAIENAKNAFRFQGPTGDIPFEPRAIEQLDKLKQIVKSLGKDTTVERINIIRETWDKIVANAGGYAQRGRGGLGIPLADATELAAKRTAASAIRQRLAGLYPDLHKLNEEYHFWVQLNDVTEGTAARTAPHGEGIGAMLAQQAGHVAGTIASQASGLTGMVGKGYAAGLILKLANLSVKSPAWRSASGVVRDRLASAMASQSVQEVARIAESLGVHVGAAATSEDPAPPPHPQASEINLTMQSDKPAGPPAPPFKNVLGNRPRGGPPAPPR